MVGNKPQTVFPHMDNFENERNKDEQTFTVTDYHRN